MSLRHIPYAYPYGKTKVLGPGTCVPPWRPSPLFEGTHSCVRNIRSFAKLLGRRLYWLCGRAVKHFVDVATPGWFFFRDLE